MGQRVPGHNRAAGTPHGHLISQDRAEVRSELSSQWGKKTKQHRSSNQRENKERRTSTVTAACNLPVDQPQSVDISTFERLKVSHVDGLIQDLWSHVPGRHKNHPGLWQCYRIKDILGKMSLLSVRRLESVYVKETSWCPLSDWGRCQWCLWPSHVEQPSPGQQWHKCSSSSPRCSWTSGLCGRCRAFLSRQTNMDEHDFLIPF